MRVAVVTPFHKTKLEWLEQCHASVRAQTHPCVHFLVSDGGGPHPLKLFDGQFIELQRNHADWADTPRAVGSTVAMGQGFDAIAYLDDDNWFHPDHVERLVQLHQKTRAPVCTSSRDLHDLEGARLGPCIESNGVEFADTNCYFFSRAAFGLLAAWVIKPQQFRGRGHGDFYLWRLILHRGIGRAHHARATIAYRTTYPVHYKRFRRPVPAGAKSEVRCMDNVKFRQDVLAYFQQLRT